MSDRKYKQKGYQDSDAPRPGRPSPPRTRRDPLERPGGRGLGKPTASVFRCAVCGTRIDRAVVAADATCPKCSTDLHTCSHCLAFDPGVPGECRKPGLAYVAAKARRNDCGGFEPKSARELEREADSPRDAKSAFDALFDF